MVSSSFVLRCPGNWAQDCIRVKTVYRVVYAAFKKWFSQWDRNTNLNKVDDFL